MKSVSIKITNNCNLDCCFCFNKTNKDKVRSIGEKEIDLVVKKLVDANIQRAVVTGGEPLIEKANLYYLLNQLMENNISAELNSNLTRLDGCTVKKLKELLPRDTTVFASIPSVIEKKCDEITGSKGAFERICHGIQLCNNEDIGIGLNMSVTKENLNEISYIKGFVQKFRLSFFSIFPVIPPAHDRENTNYLLPDDLTLIANTLVNIHKKTGIRVGSVRPLPLCLLKNKEHFGIIKSSACQTGRSRCAIDLATGHIEACSQEGVSYGNIYKDSLSESFSKMRNWKNNTYQLEECKTCKKLSECGGLCKWASSHCVPC